LNLGLLIWDIKAIDLKQMLIRLHVLVFYVERVLLELGKLELLRGEYPRL